MRTNSGIRAILSNLASVCLLTVFSAFAYPNPQELQSPMNMLEAKGVPPAPANSIIYVSDFDLDVVHRKPAPKSALRASRTSKPGSVSRSPSGVPRMGSSSESPASQSPDSSEASEEETPANQARALVNIVSENLIRALTETGYDARRLATGAPLPPQGVRVRGVFAEADELNRARRLLVGGEPTGGNLILYVGVNNLKSPEQPLYALADPPAPDPRHGPVITVTSYAPAARYELSRDPSGDELKKVAVKIAADLAALVNANRLSLAQ